MNHKINLLFILILFIFSCTENEVNTIVINEGNWLFELQLDKENPNIVLPFNASVFKKDSLVIINDQERISVTEITYTKDSVSIIIPVFGSELKAKVYNDSLIGSWYKYVYEKPYSIPFKAYKNVNIRFKPKNNSSEDISGKWKTYFISEDNDTSIAVGIFQQKGQNVTGTFLTEIGDYRYLEGIMDGNRVKLSTFDGAHAFLFEADVKKDSLSGFFKSGSHWTERWVAVKDDSYKLGDMKALTYLKEGYDNLKFSFPNENGDMVSLKDERYQNKVVIVQIFGTWCPNCMDETKYFVELYEKYNNKGLEIIALDFEPKPTHEFFKGRAERFKKNLNVKYEVLLAGDANKEKAAESLPMLNHILSYPTAIFIDRDGEIIEIHTGFSGPGTGDHYYIYKKETEHLLEKLLNM